MPGFTTLFLWLNLRGLHLQNIRMDGLPGCPAVGCWTWNCSEHISEQLMLTGTAHNLKLFKIFLKKLDLTSQGIHRITVNHSSYTHCISL